MPYQITEPHPTTTPNAYMHTGRGGAGNMYKVKASSSKVSAPLAKVTTATSTFSSSHPSAKVSTGRGGAANIRASGDIRNFSFDDEVALQARGSHHDVWHVGRGGAGNWGSKVPASSGTRKFSSESAESGSSTRSGFFGRLSGAFDRN